MKLPPLNALRSFETAARQGSFSLAGAELGVTSAAVSLQVRNLESWMDRKLFLREGNKIKLTDAGRDLYANTAPELARIADFTSSLTDSGTSRPLVISTLPALAETWLPPVLARLGARAIKLRIEEDPGDLQGESIDIRLSYGRVGYEDYWVAPLFQDDLVPMACPDMAENWDQGRPDLQASQFIHMDWGPSFTRTPKWQSWFEARGWDNPPRPSEGITVPGGATALAMAVEGVGVALGQTTLAKPLLASGGLRKLSNVTIQAPQPYRVIIAHHKLYQRRIRAFLDAAGISEVHID